MLILYAADNNRNVFMQTSPLSGTNIPAGSTAAPLQPRVQPQMTTTPAPGPSGPVLPLRVARFAATMADLEKSIGYDDGCIVTVSGFYKPRDGGGGTFQYVKDCTLPPVPGLVVVPLGAEGRYLRNLDGSPISILWTGAQAGGSYDCTKAIQAAMDFAQRPSYGTVNQEAQFCGTLSVYAPPGRYRTTAPLVLGGVDLFGKYGGGADYNCHTVFLSDHGGNFIQYNFGEGGKYQVGAVRDCFITGFHEKHQRGKVKIVSAENRTVFTVEASGVQNITVAPPWSYQLNMCFFHDAEGSYLGHGIVKGIDRATGQVVLEEGMDNYSDSGTPGNLLSSADTVVFSPTITEYGLTFVDPASAGPVAIYCTNASKAVGRVPVISNVCIERFHCGIRLAPAVLAAQFDNVSVTRFKFAGIASPVAYTTTDNRLGNVYISGLYGADYGIKHTLPCPLPVFRHGAFGVYGLGGADKVTGVIEACCHANIYVPWSLQQTLADVTLDDVKRHAILFGRGYAPAAGPHTSWMMVGIAAIRNALAGAPVDSKHPMSVFHSRCVDKERQPRLAVAQLCVINGGAPTKFAAETTVIPGGVPLQLVVTARLEANGLA